MTSGLSVSLANVTGGLPGSGTDGTVPFKVRYWLCNSGAFRSWWPAGQRQPQHGALQGVYMVGLAPGRRRMFGSDTNSSLSLMQSGLSIYLCYLCIYISAC